MASETRTTADPPAPRRPWWSLCCLSLLAAGLLLAMAPAAFLGWLLLHDPFGGQRFDARVWRAQAGSLNPDNPRGPMTSNLRRHHLRRGMARQEVVRLLGEDGGAGPHSLSYTLGAWSGFRIDYDTLDITFDASGRLERTTVVQH